MMESGEKDREAEILKNYVETFHKDLSQISAERKYQDATMVYRWTMYHVFQALLSCVLGAVVLVLATLFFSFSHKAAKSEEVFENLSYAMYVAFSALLTSTALGIFLMIKSFDDGGYHDSASEAAFQVNELKKELTDLRASVRGHDEILPELSVLLGYLDMRFLHSIAHHVLYLEPQLVQIIKQMEPLVQGISRKSNFLDVCPENKADSDIFHQIIRTYCPQHPTASKDFFPLDLELTLK